MSLGVIANVDVENLDRAIEFYGNALGLRVGRRQAARIEPCPAGRVRR